MECVCRTAPAPRPATIRRWRAVSADAAPSPVTTRPSSISRMSSRRSSPLCVALRVIASRSGSRLTTAQQRGGQGRGGGRAGWVTIKEGEECPPGTTEARHLQCAPPAAPAPSILDYRPRSTVVADRHLVPKAKFPVVDVHTHGSAAFVNQPDRIKEMDALNLRVMVDLSGGTDPTEIRQQ